MKLRKQIGDAEPSPVSLEAKYYKDEFLWNITSIMVWMNRMKMRQ